FYTFKEGQRGTWVIAGAAKVTKILSDAEVNTILADNGINPAETFKKYRNALLKKKATEAKKKAFKEWFGDSKVVDENGNPLVVYHGTGSVFTEFDVEQSGKNFVGLGDYGFGIYLTQDPKYASKYAMGAKGTPNIIPAYLSMQNPLIVRKGSATKELERIAPHARTERELSNYVKELGYDGIIVNDGIGDNLYVHEAVAFSPTQIKSVNNQGTWNSADPNILHQGNINSLNQVPSWQRSQVEKVYKNNKRFMKDLYGNKTNMTEFDWIGTRTNNFRLWFGDWLDEKTEDVSQVQEENGDPRVMFIPSKTGVGVEEPGYEVTANGSMVEVSFFPKHASETAMEMEADTVSYRTYNEMVDYKWEMKAKHSTQLIADYFGGFLDDEKVDKDKLMKQMEGVSWKVGLEMVKKYGVPDVNEALKSEGAGVMPVYVNAKNIFIPSEMFDSILSEFLWKYDQEQMSNEKAVEDFRKGYSEKYRDETIIDYLKELGFDGILMQDNYYDDSASIGVFHMSQIKSTFNDGAFDSESTDILHQAEINPENLSSRSHNVIEDVEAFTRESLLNDKDGKPIGYRRVGGEVYSANKDLLPFGLDISRFFMSIDEEFKDMIDTFDITISYDLETEMFTKLAYLNMENPLTLSTPLSLDIQQEIAELFPEKKIEIEGDKLYLRKVNDDFNVFDLSNIRNIGNFLLWNFGTLDHGLIDQKIEKILESYNFDGIVFSDGFTDMSNMDQVKNAQAVYVFDTEQVMINPELSKEEKEYNAVFEERIKNPKTYFMANNGKKSNLTERQWIHVRTPSFKKKFGDWEIPGAAERGECTNVLDENGEPRVVYHGSRYAGFTVFDDTVNKTTGAPAGVSYFAGEKSTASSYSGSQDRPGTGRPIRDFNEDRGKITEGSGMYEVFLNIRQPYVQDFENAYWNGINEKKIGLKRKNSGDIDYYEDADGKVMSFNTMSEAEFYWRKEVDQGNTEIFDYTPVQGLNNGFTTNTLTRTALAIGGFDGMIFKNVIDGASLNPVGISDVFVVFDNTNIKSATDNIGTYNEYGDILYQPEAKPLSKNSKEYKETKKRVQDMLGNKEYPKDHELALFKGEEWADKEISFRRLYAQDD
ncbi:MAG TPA: hypothetical protein VJY54_09745, partial [Lachnospiraceae bacterium]|nr:hypothetical protein [Lachnospiraceae bacterium]